MTMLILWSITLVVLMAVAFVAVVFYLRDRARTVYQSSSNRGLFRFNDGVNIRHVDPIDVMLSLDGHKEYDQSLHPRMARAGNAEAIRIQCDAIQKAFGVVEYSDPKLPGLTVTEMTQLLYSFWEYVELQKKSTEPMPISVQSTDVTSIDSEPETTNDLSLCGSIVTEG